MKKVFTAAAASAALVSTGLFAPTSMAGSAKGSDVSSDYTPPAVEWGECSKPSLKQAGAECGYVEVPLDYAKPQEQKIKLAVSRIKAKTSDEKRQGIMLVNPGGPGGSGLGLSRLGGAVPNNGGDPYDWIGFDPRGVGDSLPSLSCDGNYFGYNRPDYRAPKAGTANQWLEKTAGYSEACANSDAKQLLGHLQTVNQVRDMDSIRKALGEKQINYYGFSYGTYLGQVYATMFPQQLRRAVFDGVVNPKDVWYKANLNQDVAFDRNINIFFDWIAKNDATYHLGKSGKEIRDRWYAKLDELAKQPADGKIGPDEWTDAVLNAGYFVSGWEDDASALAAALNDNDYGPITELFDAANGSGPGSDNGYAVYLGTQCTDVTWPTSWDKWEADNSRVAKKAPFETWANAMFNLPCTSWPVKATNSSPIDVKGKDAPPVLLISETYDGATPFEGALEVRKRFPKSALIEGKNGTTHSGSLSGVSCTDDKVAAYLLTGKMPARQPGENRSDVTCDPVPQPTPGPTNAVTESASSGVGKNNGKKGKHHGKSADLTAMLQQAQGFTR